MSKAAVKKLQALVGQCVLIKWIDAAAGMTPEDKPLELPSGGLCGFLQSIDENRIAIVLDDPREQLTSKEHYDTTGTPGFACPIGWVQAITVLVPGQTVELASSFRIKRRRGKR